MIVSVTERDLVHVLSARLKKADGSPVRFFGSSQEVTAYLKQHPDTDFLLEPCGMVRELQNAKISDYNTENGDIFCGQVRFDSKTDRVVCKRS